MLVDEGICDGVAGIIFEYLDYSLKEIFSTLFSTIYIDNETDFYIVLSHDKNEKEKSLETFLRTGRCFRFDEERSEYEYLYHPSYLSLYLKGISRVVFVIEFKNRMRVEE